MPCAPEHNVRAAVAWSGWNQSNPHVWLAQKHFAPPPAGACSPRGNRQDLTAGLVINAASIRASPALAPPCPLPLPTPHSANPPRPSVVDLSQRRVAGRQPCVSVWGRRPPIIGSPPQPNPRVDQASHSALRHSKSMLAEMPVARRPHRLAELPADAEIWRPEMSQPPVLPVIATASDIWHGSMIIWKQALLRGPARCLGRDKMRCRVLACLG